MLRLLKGREEAMKVVAGLAIAGSLALVHGSFVNAAVVQESVAASAKGKADGEGPKATRILDGTTEEPHQESQLMSERVSPLTSVELIEQKLIEHVEVDFPAELSMEEFAHMLGQESGITIHLDTLCLEEYGIDSGLPVRPELKKGTLRTHLKLQLREFELSYMIRDDVLVLTTEDEASVALRLKVHDIGLEKDADMAVLIELVMSTVGVNEWDELGGNCVVRAINGKLVVNATQDVHEKTDELLQRLEALGVFADGELISPPPRPSRKFFQEEVGKGQQLRAPTPTGWVFGN